MVTSASRQIRAALLPPYSTHPTSPTLLPSYNAGSPTCPLPPPPTLYPGPPLAPHL